MDNKKTVGQVILDHDAKGHELQDDVHEYTLEMGKEIMANIHKAIGDALQRAPYQNRDFFVALVTTIDRMLKKPKNIPVVRLSCPTPVYKQSVWKYHHRSGGLEFLWSIPSALRCQDVLRNPQKYKDDEESQIFAKFIMLYESGELLEWVKKENGEDKKDAIIKVQKDEGATC